MRWSEVARGALLLPLLLVELAPLAPAPLVLVSELGDEVLEPDELEEPLVVLEAPEASDGVVVLEAPVLLPDVPDIPLDAPEVPEVPLAPPEVPLAPLEDGRLRSTSPLDVPPVAPPVDALPVDGTQFVDVIPAFALVPEVAPEVVPMPLVLAPLVLPVVPAAPAPVLIPPVVPDAPVVPAAPVVLPLAAPAVVSVPVPFAPFVVFNPVNR